MEIPIHNLYYLLLYAWDRLEEGRTVEVGDLDHAETADLLGRVLAAGTNRLLRRGLERGYRAHTAEMPQIRGRIEFAPSVRRMLLEQALAVCTTDERTPDVLTNRILRSTLARLARVRGLDEGVRHEVLQAHRRMEGVREIRVTGALFGRVHLHANNAFYRLLLSVCALVHENLLPDESGRGSRFRDFVRDEARMAALFERFVLHFYRRHRPDLRTGPETLSWDAEPLHQSGGARLPDMRTDVTLRGPHWTAVLDAKYYREATKSGTFESANLYQLTAYLRAMERSGGPDAFADGILLYPAVRASFDHIYRVGAHRLRLLTVDLAAPWPDIHERLLSIPAWSEARIPDPARAA